MSDYDENIKCPLCGCEIYDHPEISIPLGSATCSCGCPLTTEFVNKLATFDEKVITIFKLKRLLRDSETELDKQNYDYGRKEKLCLYCGSQEYKGEGIVHRNHCLILRLREVIRNA